MEAFQLCGNFNLLGGRTSSKVDKQILDSRFPDCVAIQKYDKYLLVMPDLIRHPGV